MTFMGTDLSNQFGIYAKYVRKKFLKANFF